MKNLNFPYVTGGQALNVKNRDSNSDLMEIQKFFKPIDNIFGDYEIRKKFDLHGELYLKKFSDKKLLFSDIIEKPSKELKIKTENNLNFSGKKEFRMKLDKIDIKDDSCLLIFLIFQNSLNNEIFIDFVSTNSLEISNNYYSFIENVQQKIRGKYKTKFILLQSFIVDPEKLLHIMELDSTRIDFFKNQIENDTLVIANKSNSKFDFGTNFEIAIDIFRKIAPSKKTFKVEDQEDGKALILRKIGEMDSNTRANCDNKQVLAIIELFINRKYKAKVFENHKFFKARIGYENGQYVLFLHPYESETNNPIRFPPGGQ